MHDQDDFDEIVEDPVEKAIQSKSVKVQKKQNKTTFVPIFSDGKEPW